MILFLDILHIALYIVDIPKILRDKHVTTVMKGGTAKKDFQEDSVVRKPNIYNILTIIANRPFPF